MKAKISTENLKIPRAKTDLKSLLRVLSAELETEIVHAEKQMELKSVLGEKERLERKLEQVQESIEEMKTDRNNCTERRLLVMEERHKAMMDENLKRQEAAALAKRLRKEQEEREIKRKDALEQAKILAEKEVRETAEAAGRKMAEMNRKKEERVLISKKRTAKRKEYMVNMRKVISQSQNVRKSLSEPRTTTLPRLSPTHKSILPPPSSDLPQKHYQKSKFFLILEQEKQRKRESMAAESFQKKRRKDMQKYYSDIIKEMFTPTIDIMKRKEIELVKQRQMCPVVPAKARRKSWDGKKSVSSSLSVSPIRVALKKNGETALKPRVLTDYLRDVKKTLDGRIQQILEQEAQTPSSQSPENTHISALRQEKAAHTRSELVKRLNPMSLHAFKLTETADDLLLTSVKAKISLLQASN